MNISTGGKKRSPLPEGRPAGSCGNEVGYLQPQVMRPIDVHNGLSTSPYLERILSAGHWLITKRTRRPTVLRLLRIPSSSSQSRRLRMGDYEGEAIEDRTWRGPLLLSIWIQTGHSSGLRSRHLPVHPRRPILANNGCVHHLHHEGSRRRRRLGQWQWTRMTI